MQAALRAGQKMCSHPGLLEQNPPLQWAWRTSQQRWTPPLPPVSYKKCSPAWSSPRRQPLSWSPPQHTQPPPGAQLDHRPRWHTDREWDENRKSMCTCVVLERQHQHHKTQWGHWRARAEVISALPSCTQKEFLLSVICKSVMFTFQNFTDKNGAYPEGRSQVFPKVPSTVPLFQRL